MAEDPDPEATAIALAAHASSEFSGAKVAGVTPLLVTIVEARELPFSADTFVLVESGGARNQTEVQRSSAAPVWDHLFTLRADFKPGVREELVATLWHEDVYEDQLLGRVTLDIESVLHQREVRSSMPGPGCNATPCTQAVPFGDAGARTVGHAARRARPQVV